MQTIDTCGLSCPQPLVMVQSALSGADPVDILVDNDASRENVGRAARRKGWTVTERTETIKQMDVTRLELRR